MTVPEPESPENISFVDAPVTSKNFQFNIRDLLRLFFTVVIYDLVAAMILAIIMLSAPPKPWLKGLMTLFAYIFPVGMTIFRALGRIEYPGNPFNLNEKKLPWQIIPLIAIAALSLTIPFSALTGLIPVPQLFERMFARMLSPDIASITVICVIAPVLEEVLCRGIVLRGLLNRYRPDKAILFSAIFFAAIHLNPWQGIVAFFLGLLTGWLYFKTRSVLPGIILHAAYNTGIFCFSYFQIGQKHAQFFIGLRYLIMISVCLAIFGIAWLMIRKSPAFVGRHEEWHGAEDLSLRSR